MYCTLSPVWSWRVAQGPEWRGLLSGEHQRGRQRERGQRDDGGGRRPSGRVEKRAAAKQRKAKGGRIRAGRSVLREPASALLWLVPLTLVLISLLQYCISTLTLMIQDNTALLCTVLLELTMPYAQYSTILTSVAVCLCVFVCYCMGCSPGRSRP